MGKTVYIWGEAARYENYRRAVEAAGGQALFGLETEPAVDALLLPGGGDLEPWRYGEENTASRGLEPERDAAELALLDRFTAAGKPVLGICRGLQTINVFFGGTLLQDIPGHSAECGRDRMHPVRSAGLFARLLGERGSVNSAHLQAAGRLGSGLEAAQWSPEGVTEALVHRRLPVWAVQWHPERLDRRRGLGLFRAFLELEALG